MNWHAIGAIGQILGSLATFVTVGYLVVQVHDTEKDMQRSIVEARTERNIQGNMAVAADERLVSILMKANAALTIGTKVRRADARILTNASDRQN